MGDTVLQYPKVLYALLKGFESCFYKPQFRNFCQITSSMAISNHSTISRFSKAFEERDASSLNKFLTVSPWKEDKVKNQMHQLIGKVFSDAEVFIGDDTLSEKPFAKVMEGVDTHYSSLKKQHCKGHSIVTTAFHTPEGCVPFETQMYFRKETAKQVSRKFATKNEIMCQKLKTASETIDFKYFVVDTWYANHIVIGEVKALKKLFVTQIKSNRNVTINHRKRAIKNHCREIPLSHYIYKTIDGNSFRYYETEGFISKIGPVRVLYCQMLQNDKTKGSVWSDVNYIITNDMHSPAEFVIHIYLQRNDIEPFHREAKQQLGLDKYQIQNLRGIERYLFLVVLVYVLLMVLNKLLMQKGVEAQTIGELRGYLREDCYTGLLRAAKIQRIEEKRHIAKNLAYAL